MLIFFQKDFSYELNSPSTIFYLNLILQVIFIILSFIIFYVFFKQNSGQFAIQIDSIPVFGIDGVCS